MAEQVDFDSVNLEDIHDKYDNVDPYIEQYFTAEELKNISDYEKEKYRNMKRNYLALNAIGIPYHLPDFMKRRVRARPPPAKWTSSESETEEWKPSGIAQTKQPNLGGARKKTPQQKPRVTRRQRKDKQQAEAGATAAPVSDSAAAAKAAVAKTAAAKAAVAAAAGLSSKVFKEEGLQDFDLLGKFSEAFLTDPPPPPPPGILDGPRFVGFTEEFSKPRIEALDRAMRHRRRLIDLIEEDQIKMKHLEIVDPIDTGEKEKYDKYGRKIKRAPETNHRYPKRNLDRLNYAKLEVPSDDEFLYCDECRREHLGECPVHGPLNFIPEISNTLDTSLIGTDAYARSTLLPFLCVKKSEVTKDAGYGIFASTKIPKNSVFGPYDGILTKDGLVARETGYSWLIYKDNKPNHYIDGSKKGYSNWMRWVNSACHEEEQNLLAFQLKKEIFYKVIRDIEPKEELLVWYGNEYALEMGLKVEKPTKPGCKADTVSTDKHAASMATTPAGDNLPAPDSAVPKGSGARPKEKSFAHSNIDTANGIAISIDALCAAGTAADERIVCPVCSFSFKESLIHLHDCAKTINGVEVFQCKDCYDFFCDKDYLLRHAHHQHGEPFPLEFIKRQMALKNMRQNQRKPNEPCNITSEVQENVIIEKKYGSSHSSSDKVIKQGESVKSDNVILKECISSESENASNSAQPTNEILDVKTKFETQSRDENGNQSKDFNSIKTQEHTHSGEKRFKCEYCNKGFDRPSKVAQHERTHTGDKQYKCQYCNKRISQFGDVAKHERIHTGEKPYKCEYCDMGFDRPSHVARHERSHTGEKPFKCQYCDMRFSQSGDVARHERAHSGEKRFKCQYCDMRFFRTSSVASHERTHTGKKPYKCQYCDMRFSNSGHVTTHERTHTGEKPYKCQYCDMRFSNSGHVTTHERTHTGEKPYKCQYCDMRFSQSGHVAKHERTHTGEKPYKCQYCDKRFSQSSDVARHERLHTGEKPYKCQYCDMRFSDSRSVARHERTHTGEEPSQRQDGDKTFVESGNVLKHEHSNTGEKQQYTCQYCDKKFTRPDSLKSHERTHMGEKPFKCSICDQRFTRSDSVKSHERIHTGEKPYKCPICDQKFRERRYLTKHLKIHTTKVTQ